MSFFRCVSESVLRVRFGWGVASMGLALVSCASEGDGNAGTSGSSTLPSSNDTAPSPTAPNSVPNAAPSPTGAPTVPALGSSPEQGPGAPTTPDPTATAPNPTVGPAPTQPAPTSSTPEPTPPGPNGTGGGSGGLPGPSEGGGGAASGSGGMGPAGAGGEEPAPNPAGSLGCTGSEILCQDFEAVADGAIPNGSPWYPLDDSCQYQTASFTMGVTSERANGGSRSLKVTNKHFAQCRLSANFGAHDEFWVRMYAYWDGVDVTDRETLEIDLTPGRRTSDDPAVRFGYRSKAPCEAYAGPQVTIIGIGAGEVTGCGSRPQIQREWYCFEAHVRQSDVLAVTTYINGEAMTYQSIGKDPTPDIATTVPVSEKVDHVRLGLFSTGEAQGDVYIDDLAIDAARIGCAN